MLLLITAAFLFIAAAGTVVGGVLSWRQVRTLSQAADILMGWQLVVTSSLPDPDPDKTGELLRADLYDLPLTATYGLYDQDPAGPCELLTVRPGAGGFVAIHLVRKGQN